ncbi:family 78 glycoside hydrolase catalytic domain [Paenibacillus sp. GCM10027626]|uniref:family 78 glycoside hydrolase catalytic domain n=1 Tax=Paenibacillus sp. GCM10027626 TaxID=3273411 RepID=UPI00362AB61C
MEENRLWQARWIWAAHEDGYDHGNQLVYFRKTFDVTEPGSTRLTIDLSADSRYRLYVNGRSVTTGPARGDLQTHYYDTVDLSGYLHTGTNVLAIKVLHYAQGQPRPSAVPSAHTGALIVEGSLLDGQGEVLGQLHTDSSWLCRRDQAISFLPESFTCVGGGELVQGSLLPHGWEEVDYAASAGWEQAVELGPAYWLYDGFLQPWQLAARTIPEMFERDRSFVRTMRTDAGEGIVIGQADAERSWIYVPAHGKAAVEVDAGELTTGYLRMVVEGGQNSEIVFLCSECYESADGVKGVRDQAEGNVLRGYREKYIVAGLGEQKETYETFLYRTFRFVQLEITASEEPLRLHRFYYRETGYPLEVKGEFSSSDDSLKPLWDISVRSLQRCMHEGYYDCPYYEQLQYSMDTRLQILFTYNIAGDDRLARKAIYEFHSSMLPSGMLLSRYPSIQPQVIPGFALYWIMMLYDHLLYFGDTAHAARYRSTVDAVLDWFGRRVSADGLVGEMPRGYWSYVDWVKEWETTRGVPVSSGPLTVYNLMYADALQKAAVINEVTGRPDTAAEYRTRAQQIIRAVNTHCWSEERQLYQDSAGLEQYSQHTQIWAILSGAIQEEHASKLAGRLMKDRSLLQVSYSMAFFLFRALSEAGQYEQSFELWEQWREQVKLNLTTWLEDPVSQRSDCHAWGAVPLYEFTSEILGVKPGGVGCERIIIEPKPVQLRWARGKVVMYGRVIEVAWQISDGAFKLQVAGLDELIGEVRLPDGTSKMIEREERIGLECLWPSVK